MFQLFHLVSVLGVGETSLIFEVQTQHQQVPLFAIVLQKSSICHQMPSLIAYSQAFFFTAETTLTAFARSTWTLCKHS